MIELRDLSPKSDVNGGMANTPPRLTLEEWRSQHPSNGSGLKILCATLATAIAGLLVAYFTALRDKGVSQDEMHAYVKEYSPYVLDKQSIAEHQSQQDRQIGTLIGQDETFKQEILDVKFSEKTHDGQIADLQKKQELTTNLIEAMRHK